MPHAVFVIPARMRSRRLPGKPLADIAGRPMVLHVVQRARAAAIGPVMVATEDDAIARIVKAAGVQVVMTGETVSGSDRVAEAVARIDPARHHDIVVNLQGDEPEIDPAALHALLKPLDDPAVDIATLAAPLTIEERANTSAVKLRGARTGEKFVRVDDFSRQFAIGSERDSTWRHVGVYAFRRAAIERFVTLPPSPKELHERLEQLRALDAGMRIDAALVERASRGVDTPADLAAVRERFAKGLSL